jgi:hypothetical protein
MENLLIFTEDKTGDKIGIYYHSWLSIIKEILIKYAHKTIEEANVILEKQYYQKPENYFDVVFMSHELEYHWAMLGAYGEQYWQKGISSKEPDGYYEWCDNYIKENNLNEPFELF